ncbi:MAG: glycosyltransferase family 4 protein [Syntrophaceae bacterium]|nr:glycosyltransferase family 4 protein [Syntrophaceae bacterium]
MKVLFVCGREPGYVRNAVMRKGFEKNAVEIIDCSDTSESYLARFPKIILKVLSQRNAEFDCVFVGFFGQPLVPIIRKVIKKPIIFDAFLSAYDTMCFDRKRFKPTSPAGRFFYWLDKHSCEQADRIVLDTEAHIDYFSKTFSLPKNIFHRVFVGADESVFFPRKAERDDRRFRIFYYSSFLPLHGMEHVVQAARKLQVDKEIEFIVVGKGSEYKTVRSLAERIGVENVRFIDWVPYENLPLEIAKADICLGGHFSDIEKAKRVIAGKTFQFMAMKKPVIVGDCPANRELITHKENAFFVTMADADSLVDAILELRENITLREQIAEGGYKTFVEKCNVYAIAGEIKRIIDAVPFH